MTQRVSGTVDIGASTVLTCGNYSAVLRSRIFTEPRTAGSVDLIGEPPAGGSHAAMVVIRTHRLGLPTSMLGSR